MFKCWSSFDRYFDNFDRHFEDNQLGWEPDALIQEEDKSIVIHMDLPGVRKADVSITIENSVLTVAGSRDSIKSSSPSVSTNEIRYGQFSRGFSLNIAPDGFDPSSIKAEMEDGVLTITLPLAKTSLPHRVLVK